MALPMPPFFKRKTDRIPKIGEPSYLPTLPSRRLNLCWIDYADVAGIYEIYSDTKVTHYSTHSAFTHQDDAHIYIENLHHGFNDGRLFQWGVCLKGSQKLIGTCTLNNISSEQGRAEVGFAIASEHWGHGYGHEAMNTLINHGFHKLGLRRLEADVDPHNAACLKSLEALGFKREGYLRQRWQVAGELQDSVLLGLLKSDWLHENSSTINISTSASALLE
jgi:[ribosomal protein S5]-alanine N-acetyltransferase